MADPAAPLEDLLLVARCREGEEAAARELFRREQGKVQASLYRILGSNRDMEDLLQETFLEGFRSLHLYRGEARLSTWLARIAMRIAIRHLRKERRGGPRVSLELVANPPGEPGTAPDRIVRAREGLRALYRALDAVSPTSRIVFVLHLVEGLSLSEVADRTSATVTATKVRLWRARRKLASLATTDPALAELLKETP